jgi:hypothetical protein
MHDAPHPRAGMMTVSVIRYPVSGDRTQAGTAVALHCAALALLERLSLR